MKNIQVNKKAHIILFAKGMVIGVANIIPGVSGGTLAVALGIYDKIIEAISNFFSKPEKRKAYTIFLATLFLGAISAVVLLANLMTYLLDNHYQMTMFAFMGLIAGGLPAIWLAHSDMKMNRARLVSFIIGAAVVVIPGLWDIKSPETDTETTSVVLAIGLTGYIGLLLAGFMAGGGMIIPGISGSFIMVLMGQYHVIISAIKNFSLIPLLFVGAGAAAGILVFSRIIDNALKKAPSATYYFILGLVTASLWVIFPSMPSGAGSALAGGAVFLSGAAVAFLMSKNSS